MATKSNLTAARHVVLLSVACLAVLFLNLGKARLWDRDEPRNAGCAAEMLAAGNWVVPIFNDELRQQKPVLLYWLMMSAYAVFGQNEFAARFWSAVLGCGTVLLTYSIGRHIRDDRTGLLAGLVLVSSLMFCVAGRAATPDSVLIFCVTAALWFCIREVVPDEAAKNEWFPQSWAGVSGVYGMLGFAVLAKGPIGFVLPMMVMGMFALIQRKQTGRSEIASLQSAVGNTLSCFAPSNFLQTLAAMKVGWGIAIVLLIAAPWFVAVGIQTEGEFNRRFFLLENLGRATSVLESHAGGWWYYLLTICGGFFPWSVLFGPVIYALVFTSGSVRESAGVRLMVIWISLQVVVFSLVATKLPSYVTPCYPALAVLTAVGLRRFESQKLNSWWLRGWLLAGTGVLMISGMAMFALAQKQLPQYLPRLLIESPWLPAVGLIATLGGAVATIWVWIWKPVRFAATMTVTAVVFCSTLFGLGTVAVDEQRQLAKITSLFREQSSRPIASWRCLEPSWIFYSRRPIYELSTRYDAVTAAGDQPLSVYRIDGVWQTNPSPTIEQFVLGHPDSLVITTDKHLDELKNRLPADFEILQTADRFLEPGKLVVFGRKP